MAGSNGIRALSREEILRLAHRLGVESPQRRPTPELRRSVARKLEQNAAELRARADRLEILKGDVDA
jgi:hypothetical protein